MSHQDILHNSYSGYAYLTGIVEEAAKKCNAAEKKNLLRCLIECHEANPIRNSSEWVKEWKAMYATLNTEPQCF